MRCCCADRIEHAFHVTLMVAAIVLAHFVFAVLRTVSAGQDTSAVAALGEVGSADVA